MVTFRQALNKPISWFRQQSRNYLLGWLAWNDRHGSYRDEDLEEGMEPLTKAEALDLIQMALDDGQSYNPGRKGSRGKKTKKKNPPPEGMLMGRLVSIEVKINGCKKTIKPKGKYLGYLPMSSTLCVMHGPKSMNLDGLSGTVTKLHKQFHNTGPTRATRFTWPDPVGKKVDVGLIVAITYSIPRGLESPDKKNYLWHHEFGDHGERGHGPVRSSGRYPESLMPMLQKDSRGNLFIRRRRGNKFYVTDWLYW